MKECNIFEVWEDYRSSLLGYIKKRVPDHDDSKDILQEVLLKSYQYCSNGKNVIHLKSWLYKITQNTIIDYHKKNNKTTAYLPEIEDENEERSVVGEASDYIKSLIKLLPDEYANPLYLSDIKGIDQKVIAKSLGLTLPNTKSRIQRARVKLKDKFLECCIVSFGENGEMTSFDIKPECPSVKNNENDTLLLTK